MRKLQASVSVPSFYVASEDMNSGPHAPMTGILLTEPCSQPCLYLFLAGSYSPGWFLTPPVARLDLELLTDPLSQVLELELCSTLPCSQYF